MEKSQSIKNIADALVKFAAAVGKIAKSESNPFFKSKYAALPDILAAIAQPMQDAGLFISQHPTTDGLVTILMHCDSGEYLQSVYPLNPNKQNDPQALGSAITYARRYAIGAILNLNIDEDDDGNAASGKKQVSAPAKPVAKPADLPELKKVDENGELTKNWLAIEDWIINKGGDPEKVRIRYKVSDKLMEELKAL